jgi:hypothetical protein
MQIFNGLSGFAGVGGAAKRLLFSASTIFFLWASGNFHRLLIALASLAFLSVNCIFDLLFQKLK